MSISKIVLIDDDETVNFINRKLIERTQFADEVVVHSQVGQALEYLESLSSEDLPELIFVDINMPELDGWDFIERYAKVDESNRSKVVLLTSLINPKDQERVTINARINAFREKPVTPDLLDEVKGWF